MAKQNFFAKDWLESLKNTEQMRIKWKLKSYLPSLYSFPRVRDLMVDNRFYKGFQKIFFIYTWINVFILHIHICYFYMQMKTWYILFYSLIFSLTVFLGYFFISTHIIVLYSYLLNMLIICIAFFITLKIFWKKFCFLCKNWYICSMAHLPQNNKIFVLWSPRGRYYEVQWKISR